MTDTVGRQDPKREAVLDVPSPLRAKRDEFVQAFLKKGAEFAEELIRDNDRMQRTLDELEAENAALKRQLASDGAMRELLSKIRDLEREKDQLLSHRNAAEAASTRFAARSSAIEEELSMLANVYVASYQLNSTLKLDLVIRHINELLGQLVGSRSHGVFLIDEARRELVCVGGDGLTEEQARAIPIGGLEPGESERAVVERVFLTGVSAITEDPHEDAGRVPAACVPMRVDDRLVGVIVVYSVLGQKLTFMPVDFELFKLLLAHAGTAIFGAQLFEAAGRVVPSPESINKRKHRR